MITYRVRGVALLHSITLAVVSAALFWIWIGVHFSIQLAGTPVTYERYVMYTCVMIGALGLDLLVSKLHDTDLLQLDLFGVMRLTLRQVMTILGVFLLFLVAQKDTSVSRFFLFSFIPVLYFTLLTLNRVSPRFIATTLFRTGRREGTLLVGTPTQARRLVAWIESKSNYGVDIVGLVSDDVSPSPDVPWKIIGRTKDLEEIIQRTSATQVISLQMPNAISRAARLAKLCEQLGVRLLIVNDIEERFSRPVYFFEDSGVSFVSLREEPLECPFNRLLKRALDISLALPVVILVLPPLCLLVHLVHRCQSPGPLFFRQRRTGIRLKGFQIYKFRTMHVLNHDEAAQAVSHDPRVFALGRWLRRLSLDELPQFINVLQGEMSVVGPRPHMIEHDSLFEKVADIYRVRSFVKPGITGLAQVQGFRGEARRPEDVVERVRSDVYYLENWSLGLDWKIIFQTAWQMLRPPKSAY